MDVSEDEKEAEVDPGESLLPYDHTLEESFIETNDSLILSQQGA